MLGLPKAGQGLPEDSVSQGQPVRQWVFLEQLLRAWHLVNAWHSSASHFNSLRLAEGLASPADEHGSETSSALGQILEGTAAIAHSPLVCGPVTEKGFLGIGREQPSGSRGKMEAGVARGRCYCCDFANKLVI